MCDGVDDREFTEEVDPAEASIAKTSFAGFRTFCDVAEESAPSVRGSVCFVGAEEFQRSAKESAMCVVME